MSDLRIYGAAYSVYTRIARLVLEECAVPYVLMEIDIFAKDDLPPDYLIRHPFSKIPVLEQGDFRLFETDAIAQYLVASFGGGSLLPDDPTRRARCLQLMRICDNYAYPRLVWGVFVAERERAEAPGALLLAEARVVLRQLEAALEAPFFLGRDPTLADLWALPMLSYLRLAPSGPELLADCPGLLIWLDAMAPRASVRATRFPKELEA